MTFDINSMPKIIIFEEGVVSHTYSHGADLIIDRDGRVVKDRKGKFGMARRDEIEAATLVTWEMARQAVAYHKARANEMVGQLLGPSARKGASR